MASLELSRPYGRALAAGGSVERYNRTVAGVSGAIPFSKREKGGSEALAAAATLDRLIVTKLDRLGRKAGNLLGTIDEFDAAGCAFVSISESIDTLDAERAAAAHGAGGRGRVRARPDSGARLRWHARRGPLGPLGRWPSALLGRPGT